MGDGSRPHGLHCNHLVGRRAVLAGGAGLLLGAAAPSIGSKTAAPIDVHHHIAPPFWNAAVADWDRRFQIATEVQHAWTPEKMFANLAMAGGARAVLSISVPAAAPLSGVKAIELARQCNDYSADLVRSAPEQLAFFVTVPMPDVQASIAEIDRAMALPGAAGVTLLTSYDGIYIGDPKFDALMAHLERRKCVTFVHPTTAPCCVGLTPFVFTPLIEFPVDTARAVGTMIWSGTVARCPNVKFIFSHSGGATAMLTERIHAAGAHRPDAETLAPGGFEAMLRRLYVDTAQASHPAAIAAARLSFGDDHLLFGSDTPWADVEKSLANIDKLNLDPEMRARIRHANAQRLLNRFT